MKSGFLRHALCLTLACPAFAHAGGLYMYEVATSDIGFAGAGTAARAEDASTVYANPAGMTRLAGKQLTVGAQALYGSFDYKVNDQSLAQQNFGGGSPGNVVGWMPGASLFYSHSIDDRLKVGIATYSNYGLALDYGNDWAGRNLTDQATLMAMTVQPTVAYKLNDHWSVGAGLTANYGMFKLQRVAAIGGGNREEKDYDWEYGARLGVMFEPSPAMRIGTVWTSKVEYDFEVNASVTGLLGRTRTFPVAASINAPQQVMFSVYQKLSERWAMTGNLGWQDWSEFSQTSLELNGSTSTSNLELQDTWNIAFGAQYQYSATTRVNAGVAYDTSWYKSNNQASFALPSSQAWRFGLGAQYTLSPKSELGVAVEYLRGSTMRDSSQLIGGEYSDPYMAFLSAQYSYKF